MRESSEARKTGAVQASPNARRYLRSVLLLLLCLLLGLPLAAQDRPLKTPDTEIVPSGTLRAEVGFDFLQDARIPFSALSGDMTSLGVLNLRLGIGQIVEFQLQGTVQNFLDIKSRGASFTPLQLSSPNSTNGTGDFSLWTKIRILGEQKHRPAVAFRFGFELPNSNQAKGIGINTTNVFATIVLQKHFGKLNVFGDVGIGILQAPLVTFSQNDELVYGGAFLYPLHHRLNLVGEVEGRRSSRPITSDLIGTESHSLARLGFQVLAGGFQWDVAGVAGLTKQDPKAGFTFGVSRDIHLFRIPVESK
jgi:hypothetical protein